MINKKFYPGVFLFVFTVMAALFAKEDGMLLKIGSKAPDFTMLCPNGATVSLHDFDGKNPVVLIFYQGDESPYCTKQLCAIRDDFSRFREKNAKVFAVNPANEDSHRKFEEKYHFQFPLLIDEKKVVAKLYGCEEWPVVKRTVYIIDNNGNIVYAKRGMPDDAEILDAIPRN